MSVKVGDRITKPLEWVAVERRNGYAKKHHATGTVTYVHPEGRFYMMEFKIGERTLKECFNE